MKRYLWLTVPLATLLILGLLVFVFGGPCATAALPPREIDRSCLVRPAPATPCPIPIAEPRPLGECPPKPFCLDAAEAGAKIVTRDGKDAKLVCVEAKRLIVEVGNDKYELKRSGRWCETTDSWVDLFMVPAPHEAWVNVYRLGDVSCKAALVYATKAEADAQAGDRRVACVKVTWCE